MAKFISREKLSKKTQKSRTIRSAPFELFSPTTRKSKAKSYITAGKALVPEG